MNAQESYRRTMDFHLWRQGKIGLVLEKAGAFGLVDKQSGFSFGSIKAIVYHIAWAEETWLSRVDHLFKPFLRKEMEPVVLMKEWNRISLKWDEIVRKNTEADWNRVVQYTNTEGKQFSNTVDEIFTHFSDHATYHTGQLMATVRSLGMEPMPTSFINYFREKTN